MALKLSLKKPTPEIAKQVLNTLLYLSGAFALLQNNFDIPEHVAAEVNKYLLSGLALVRFTINFFHWDNGSGSNSSATGKTIGVGTLIILLMLNSCTMQQHTITKRDIQIYAQMAGKISAKMIVVANNPMLDSITRYTPDDWDNKTIARVRNLLSKALPVIGIAENCADADLETMLRCIVSELRKLNGKQQAVLLAKVTDYITTGQVK